MKPVVTRLVVFGAAVGSLALLAGAVRLVVRLAPPTDLYEEKRLARSVEVVPEQGARRPAPAEPPAKAPSTVKPAEMPSPAPVPKPEPRRVAQPKVPTPAPATPPRLAPAPPTPVPTAPAAPPPVASTPVAPASVPPRPAPQESESTDGSAAVDWLLKGRR